jgi:hypothetical protein
VKAYIQRGFIQNVSLVTTAITLSGCVTGTTWHAAHTDSHVDEKNKLVIDHKGKPAYYALLPLAVTADVALLPAYLVFTIAVNVGLAKPP